MKVITLIFLSFLSFQSLAQDTIAYWSLIKEFPVAKDEVWALDVIGNVYLTNKKVIEKYDSTGTKKFTQSIKSFGKIEKIDPVNTMKIIVFSEDQQQFCMLDNTLSLTEKCIDFADLEIGNAIDLSVSGQPDKIWAIDQLNSTLSLLSLSGTYQHQEIKNLSGILNLNLIQSISEKNNELYLTDQEGTVYQFDIYGSLMNTFRYEPFSDLEITEDSFILLSGDKLKLIRRKDGESDQLSLPVPNVKAFSYNGEVFCFQTENKLFTYRLNLGR